MRAMSGAVESFEQEFAAWLGVRGAVATGFGRAALALALEALPEVAQGGEVLVPEFICVQVPEAVRRAGGRPALYRVERNLRVTPAAFRSAFGPGTRAAIVAHYFGRVQPEMETLAEMCRERGVPMIEDCALAWGAQRGGRWAGRFGDAAVFSLTKSEWCYGGGVATTDWPAWLAAMRDLRARKFRNAGGLALAYGLLRCADFACNRPSRVRAGEWAGRRIEQLLARVSPAFRSSNFFDAGVLDALMWPRAVPRARHLLRTLQERRGRQGEVRRQLACAAQYRSPASPGAATTTPPQAGREQDQNTGGFLLLACHQGDAEECRERASKQGVTLRLVWPAYQTADPAYGSEQLAWLARHLLLLEIHPALTDAEIQRVVETLRGLGCAVLR
jgi:dTDP-4-amino-4,6-dideoxygalactose transaminase